MCLVGARQAGIITVKPAVRVVRIEIPVSRQTFFEDEFQSVVTPLRTDRVYITQVVKSLKMKPSARIADYVSFAARTVNDTRILHGLVNILVRVASTEN